MSRRGVLLLAAALAAAAAFAKSPGRVTDLKICVSCAGVLASGGDPYARDVVVDGVTYPCLYPPLAFDLYRPVAAAAAANPELAARAWNALQVLLFLLLLWIWRTRFLALGPDAARLIFALFAFGGPLFVVLHSGNGSLVEQALLWGAFACYAAGNDWAFVALIALAAQLKIQPAALLVLVLLRPKPGWRPFLAGAAGAALLFGFNELIHPGLLASFRARLADPVEGWRYERGPNNCSVLGFTQHVLEVVMDKRPLTVKWSRFLYAPWFLFVAAATGAALRRAWAAARDEASARRMSVLLVCAAYALLAPRFKDYAFFLIIPSALVALESGLPPALFAAIAGAAVLNSTMAVAAKLGLGRWALLAGYFKLYAVLLVWGVLVFRRHSLIKSLESPSGNARIPTE